MTCVRSDSVHALNVRPPAKCAPASPWDREAVRRIRDVRVRLKLSQLELAERLGVVRQTVENWERHTAKIPAAKLLHAESLLERTGT